MTNSNAMPRPGDRIGPFEVVAPLGTGGMGAVYQATDKRLGRSVALKLPLWLAIDEGDAEATARAWAAIHRAGPCFTLDELVHRGLDQDAIDGAAACYAHPDTEERLAGQYEMFVLNPLLTRIRDDPRLAAFMTKGRTQYRERLELLVAARSRGELPPYLEPTLDGILIREGMR